MAQPGARTGSKHRHGGPVLHADDRPDRRRHDVLVGSSPERRLTVGDEVRAGGGFNAATQTLDAAVVELKGEDHSGHHG